MKRLVFFFTFIGLCASMTCRAQLDEERHTFAVGFNGGLNMSSVNFDPKIKQNKQNGMSAGATLRYITEKYFSTKPSTTFVAKSSSHPNCFFMALIMVVCNLGEPIFIGVYNMFISFFL